MQKSVLVAVVALVVVLIVDLLVFGTTPLPEPQPTYGELTTESPADHVAALAVDAKAIVLGWMVVPTIVFVLMGLAARSLFGTEE